VNSLALDTLNLYLFILEVELVLLASFTLCETVLSDLLWISTYGYALHLVSAICGK